jgi:hypothetical protein
MVLEKDSHIEAIEITVYRFGPDFKRKTPWLKLKTEKALGSVYLELFGND